MGFDTRFNTVRQTIAALAHLTVTGLLTLNGGCDGCVFKRWLIPYHWSPAATSQASTAGTEYCALFEVPEVMSVDNITYVVGATPLGNVKGAIFGPVVTNETLDGAPLVVQSATTTVDLSATNSPQAVSLTETELDPGVYGACLLWDNSSNTFMRNPNQTQVTGWGQTEAGAATVGSGFQATMDTPTNTGSAIPAMTIRVAP